MVHLETCAVQALAATLDDSLAVLMGPFPERDLRQRLERFADAEIRARGLAASDRLEAARHSVAVAGRDGLAGALAELDRIFTELTGRAVAHGAGSGRRPHLTYLDCMRGLDVELGPGLMAELRLSLPPLLASSRWYCGQAYELGRER